MRLFLFGAGATMGTLGWPGVKSFGLSFAERVPGWRGNEDFSALAGLVDALPPAYRRSPNDWDLDAAWTRLDYLAKLDEALDIRADDGSTSIALHRAVAEMYGTLSQEGLRAAWEQSGEEFTLRNVLANVQRGDVVASFNWDILVELLLVRISGLQVVQSPWTSGCVRLVKPHGSLSWRRRIPLAGDRVEEDFLDQATGGNEARVPSVEAMPAKDIRRNDMFLEQPMLLGAVPIKSELIREVQGTRFEVVYRRVMEQWRMLCGAFREANELFVVGYGFPAEDAYAHFLLREAARSRAGPAPSVYLYEIETRRRQVTDEIVRVLAPNGGGRAQRLE